MSYKLVEVELRVYAAIIPVLSINPPLQTEPAIFPHLE